MAIQSPFFLKNYYNVYGRLVRGHIKSTERLMVFLRLREVKKTLWVYKTGGNK